MERVAGSLQKADVLTKALGRTKFGEMRELIGLRDLASEVFKFRRVNVGDKLESICVNPI